MVLGMFVVLLTHNLEGSRAFYERIGQSFVREQHGKGPVHYSAMQDGDAPITVEIFPAGEHAIYFQQDKFFVGFEVDENPFVLQRELIAKHGGEELLRHPPVRNAAWLRDPQGLLVRLSQVRPK